MPAAPSAICEATFSTEQPVTSASGQGKPAGARPRRVAGLLTRLLKTSYVDPLFERPDLIENDYYRFVHQPRG